jgi:hypothetical protein
MTPHDDVTVPPSRRWSGSAIVAAPVRYRRDHGGEWQTATVIEISRFGIVIRTSHGTPPLYTPLELLVTLTAAAPAVARDIECYGRVVNVAGPSAGGEWLMSVAIDE